MAKETILIVEDDSDLRGALSDTLELAGYNVSATDQGQSALDKLANEEIGLLLSDLQMRPMDGYTLLKKAKAMLPELPVLIMTAYGTVKGAVDALHEGASDYLIKPFEADDLLERVQRYIRTVSLDEMIAVDKSSRDLLTLSRRVADTDATVLISGESGTGKEVLARFLHNNSVRKNKPFIAINCAAIPENMLEATLFGYEKGSFTGASQAYAGKFEQAQQGTILLDEISEMDLNLQAKLLRVLQEREVERIGGRKLISLDVRVLATTNKILREEVNSGKFREDLFYRLNVFPLQLLPLRERTDDILPLAQQVIRKHCQQSGRSVPRFSSGAEERLIKHLWQGNVRELDNVLQRALILQPSHTITANDLAFETMTNPQNNITELVNSKTVANLGDDLRSHEQRHIIDALEMNNSNRRSTALALGISERTLRYKLSQFRELGISIPEKVGKKSA
ncbi:MAG: sigma-54-dependent Fis family transcriptional regulator [Piscirickettsiaceae bacterium]|nr:sigma-54-dependent Fis family transcriptional regulator [Piscirickettsiaceae bacterium]